MEADVDTQANDATKPAPKTPIQLEAALIAQEHRLLALVRLFLFERPHWPKDDPRRRALWLAAVQQIIPSASVAATGAVAGTIIAALTLWTLVDQNQLIDKQNRFFEDQNQYFRSQNKLIEDQNQYFREQNAKLQQQINDQNQQHLDARRTELIAILYESLPPEAAPEVAQGKAATTQPADTSPPEDHAEQDPAPRPIPKYNVRTRSEALIEFVTLERKRLGYDPKPSTTSTTDPDEPTDLDNEDASDDDPPPRVNLTKALLQDVENQGSDLRYVNLQGAHLEGADLSHAHLEGALLFDAKLVEAYLNGTHLERAHLIGAKLKGAYLSDAKLEESDLRNANLEEASLYRAILEGAYLSDAKLEGALLSAAHLKRADLRGADLTNIKHWQAIASINLANIHGIENAPEGFREWASERGAVDEPDYFKWRQMLRNAGLLEEDTPETPPPGGTAGQ